MDKKLLHLEPEQIKAFEQDGYLVVPAMANGADLEHMQKLAHSCQQNPSEPWELEAATGYPGAPQSTGDKGGSTVRRLLDAYHRDPLWQQWATSPQLSAYLSQLFGNNEIHLSLAHHNCLMTKSPQYSSDTLWHQDIRYWSFQKQELISAWLALGSETQGNGGLVVIPGSHKANLVPNQFDEKLFFKTDIETNKRLIEQERAVHLDPGDTLFFHCKLLHRASRNHSNQTKLSLVFTYRQSQNLPITGTRSAGKADIAIRHSL